MATKTVTVNVKGDTTEYQDSMGDAAKSNKEFDKAVDNTVKASAVAFAAIAASIFGVVKAADSYDARIKQVQKTTGLAGDELNNFKKEIDRLTIALPGITDKELLEVSKIAGQLGITGADSITKFAGTVAKLTLTTDLTADSAATALARILEFSSDTIDEVDKLASTITLLGSTTNATEAQILASAEAVAVSTAAYDINAETIAAFATTLVEAGIQAEVSGSSMTMILNTLTGVVAKGGTEFDRFAELTGKSKKELDDLAKTKPEKLFVEFAGALNEAGKRGERLNDIQEEFGFNNVRVQKVLTGVASKFESLQGNLSAASKEFEVATRLNSEFETQTDTLGNQLTSTGAILSIFSRNVGLQLTEDLKEANSSVGEFLLPLSNLSETTNRIIALILVFSGALAGLVLATTLTIKAKRSLTSTLELYRVVVSKAAAGNGILASSLRLISSAANIASSAFAKLTIVLLTNPFVLISVAVGALVTGLVILSNKIQAARDRLQEAADEGNIIAEIFVNVSDVFNNLGKSIFNIGDQIRAKIKETMIDPVVSFINTIIEAAQKIPFIGDALGLAADTASAGFDFVAEKTIKFKDNVLETIRILNEEKALMEQEGINASVERVQEEANRKQEIAVIETESKAAELRRRGDIEKAIQLKSIKDETTLEKLRQKGIEKQELEFLKRQNKLDLDFKKLDLEQDKDFARTKRELLLVQQATLDKDRRLAQKRERSEVQSFLGGLLRLEKESGEERVLTKKQVAVQIGMDARSAADSLFGSNKKFQLATAIGDTAVAVTKALSAAPFPLNLPLAAGAAAAGAAQIASIKGISFQTGGFVPGGTTFDSVNAILRPGEFVAPPQDAEAAALGVARNRGMIEDNKRGDVNIEITVEGSLIGTGTEDQLAEELAELIIPEIRNQQQFNNAESLL